MFFVLKVLILVGLVRLLVETRRPFLCAGIYALAAVVPPAFTGAPLSGLAVAAALTFVLAAVYFWLLNRLEGGLLWWLVLLGGLAIGLV